MENNNTHPDENDTRTFAYCPCCGRHVEMPSRDEDHADWCANRNGYTDDVVEVMSQMDAAEDDRINALAARLGGDL